MNLRRFVETNHFPESKTRPRIQSTSQNPKQVPKPKAGPRIQKHFPKSIKTLPRIQNTFGFWDLSLDSGKCFWILGSIFPYEQRSTKKLQSWRWVGLKRLIITMKTWVFSTALLQTRTKESSWRSLYTQNAADVSLTDSGPQNFTVHQPHFWCNESREPCL